MQSIKRRVAALEAANQDAVLKLIVVNVRHTRPKPCDQLDYRPICGGLSSAILRILIYRKDMDQDPVVKLKDFTNAVPLFDPVICTLYWVEGFNGASGTTYPSCGRKIPFGSLLEVMGVRMTTGVLLNVSRIVAVAIIRF